jgi:ribosomal protein S12 methylthiotransferase accessory factor
VEAPSPGAIALAPHLDVTPVQGKGVVVLATSGDRVFAGEEFARVVAAVDGRRPAPEVVKAAGGDELAQRALDELSARGVVVPADDALPAAEAAYWSHQRLAPTRVAERMAAAVVTVETHGDVDAESTLAGLAAAGVRVEGGAEHLVVLTDDYLRESLAARNADALESGRPWLLAAPGSAEPWIGPLFRPDRGACWECLAQRLRRGRRIDRILREAFGRDTPIDRMAGAVPTSRQLAAGAVATEVVRWIAGGDRTSPVAERVLTLDTISWHTQFHDVTWRPQCPACGAPDASRDRGAAPIELPPSGTPIPPDLRATPPEETVERFVHHVSPVSGVVPVLARPAGTRAPLYAYLAGEPGPQVHQGSSDWQPAPHTPAGGKGTTDAQARASALCEALERYCGEFTGEESRRGGTLEELAPVALHPNAAMAFSDAQYRSREEINARNQSGHSFVPEPFDPAARIDWTPVWSLTAQAERLLPTAFCYYHAPVAGQQYCPADSNGNAAGNTLEEAILQGFLELVERDHVALWWYNRLARPAVDLDSVGDPWLDAVRGRLQADGRELWVLDLTADLGIPVAAAIATAVTGQGRVAIGLGAHLDLRRATLRAVTEMVQISTYTPSGGLGLGPQDELDTTEGSHLRPSGLPPSQADPPRQEAEDIRHVIDDFRERIEARGMEMLVLDQTRPDIGLPVVKVVVPGLRHFWRRFAPGRLYDVPVALGDLSAPTPEADLNPISVMG